MVTVNGKALDITGQNLATFLEESGYKQVRIVVEINEEIIPRET
ncbi:sulfur carrier protein ThiS, partial [Coprococcus eutactus]